MTQEHRTVDEAPFNFAAASPLDRIAHGAQRPGYSLRAPIGPEPVDRWARFMTDRGIRRVLCLLDDSQLRLYREPLLEHYRRCFERVDHAPIPDYSGVSPASLRIALEALDDARASDAPLVVHCSAGMGRTGQILAAWLMARHGLDPDEAGIMIVQQARQSGAVRAPLEAGPDMLDRIAGMLRDIVVPVR